VAVVSRKVRDKARSIAATMLETRPEDLAWEKGRWYVKGDPEKGALIEDIAQRAYSGEAMPEGMEGGLDAQVIYDPPNLTYPTAPTSRSSTSTPTRHRSRSGASSRSTTAACGSTR
jgi:carbon-monoxide dehydrogenase large subunit